MKPIVCAAALLAATFSTTAVASADLARRQGCTNCHAAEDGNRRMPSMSFPALAKQFGPVGEDKLVAQLHDRSTGHPAVRSSPEQTRQIIRWMLTLK